MKNLDEYTTEDLLELSSDIETLMESQVDKRKKKEFLQWEANLKDRMKLYHKISGEKVWNLNYGK